MHTSGSADPGTGSGCSRRNCGDSRSGTSRTDVIVFSGIAGAGRFPRRLDIAPHDRHHLRHSGDHSAARTWLAARREGFRDQAGQARVGGGCVCAARRRCCSARGMTDDKCGVGSFPRQSCRNCSARVYRTILDRCPELHSSRSGQAGDADDADSASERRSGGKGIAAIASVDDPCQPTEADAGWWP